VFVFVGYNFGDQRETEFLGSGNMPKKQGTHAQVCKGSSVSGHAPRKALKVKKIRKGTGKSKPLKGAVQNPVAIKKGAGGQKKKKNTAKPPKAAKAVTAAELGLGSDSGTPEPRSPTYEPTEAWVMDVAARIDAATVPGAPSDGAAGAGPP